MSIRIFLADDHTSVRDGLRSLLEEQRDFEVAGEAANGREAVNKVRKLQPDIIIMDITMPELNGLEAARHISKAGLDTKVIILSMHSSTSHVLDALRAGVRGYLLKASAGANVVEAVWSVYSGRRYLSPEVVDKVIEHTLLQQSEHIDRAADPLERLSPREREVLQLVVEGKSSAEIAQIIHLSPKTVETYRGNLMKKLEIKNLPELVKFAVRHGLTPLE